MSDVLQLQGITKAYTQGGVAVPVLENISLNLAAGEAVALIGQSGSGKSTLLHIAGLLDAPDAGEVVICGANYTSANDASRTRARRESLGFVYQFHHLLADLSAVENVGLPLRIRGASVKEADAQATQILEKMGLGHRLSHKPFKLSGGEQQRVAIARALVPKPTLILADEPTGSLDSTNGQAVLKLLLAACREQGTAILMATHNLDLASHLHRSIKL